MDDLFFDILSKCKKVPSVVMDIGTSSGVTTLEWLNEFDKRGIPVSMIASDLTISTYLADIGAGWRALLEPTGHILQIEFAGFGLRSWFRRLDYATGTFSSTPHCYSQSCGARPLHAAWYSPLKR